MDGTLRLSLRLLLSVLLMLVGTGPAFAQGAGWIISEAKGSVLIMDARGTRAGAAGQTLEPGETLRTAARSSAVLVRGKEFMTVRQNAQIRIPEAVPGRSIIQIIQDYGSALFNIGKKADPHFGVETPHLVAVVKGTTFIITVSPDSASLQVTEGAVEAATRDGGARELVRPGAVAVVAAADPMRLVIEGDGRRVIDSPARAAPGGAASETGPDAGPEPAAAAHGPLVPVSTDMRAVSAPSPFSMDYRGARRIDAVIVSSPGDARGYSGGFVAGEVAVIAGAIVADNTARGNAPSFNSGNGASGNGAGSGPTPDNNGNPGNSGNGNGAGNAGGNGNAGNNGNPGNSGNGNGAGNAGGNSNAGNNGSPGNSGNGNGAGNANPGGSRIQPDFRERVRSETIWPDASTAGVTQYSGTALGNASAGGYPTSALPQSPVDPAGLRGLPR